MLGTNETRFVHSIHPVLKESYRSLFQIENKEFSFHIWTRGHELDCKFHVRSDSGVSLVA